MKPLDHINRDWKRGNCYYISLQFLKDSEQLRIEGRIATSSVVYLVHGILSYTKRKINHAWIELDDEVIDHSNNQAIKASKTDYYVDNDALPVRRFTREQADALLLYLQTEDGGLPICYWGALSDETIREAMTEFRPANSIFASDVVFSDPSDPANNQETSEGKIEEARS